jgi:hypothetical protein
MRTNFPPFEKGGIFTDKSPIFMSFRAKREIFFLYLPGNGKSGPEDDRLSLFIQNRVFE